jgi:hypothetical protein
VYLLKGGDFFPHEGKSSDEIMKNIEEFKMNLILEK